MFGLLTKQKEYKSPRSPSLYDNSKKEYKFTVKIECYNNRSPVPFKSESIVEITAFSTHHCVKYECKCGTILELAFIDYVYAKDSIQGCDHKVTTAIPNKEYIEKLNEIASIDIKYMDFLYPLG